MCEQKINPEIADKAQIPLNINANSQRTAVLAEFVVICPKCNRRGIISAKKVQKYKLGICRACLSKTWLKFEGKLKRFGRNRQYSKIVWFTSLFEEFWLLCGAN